MAYLDPNNGVGVVDDAIATYPAAAAPANGTSMPAVLKFATDALVGANGVVTYPAAAAPANGVSLAEVLAAIYEHLRPKTIVSSATVTDASQTETTPFALITIAPAAGAPLRDVEVVIDLAKASTGFGAVETSITVQFAVARKVDGANWRRDAYLEAALSGTLAVGRSAKIPVGIIGVTEQVAIYAVFSADVTTNIVLPFIINYCGLAAPTVS